MAKQKIKFIVEVEYGSEAQYDQVLPTFVENLKSQKAFMQKLHQDNSMKIYVEKNQEVN